MRNELTAVILAGGKGTRLQIVCPNVPKPLARVQGRPFLYWVTAWFAHQGVTRFVYSVGHMADQIVSWCANASMPGLTRIACIEKEPLGTAGGLLNCLGLCDEWVLVANGDSICFTDLSPMFAMPAAPYPLGGAILGVYAEDADRYGTLEVDSEGFLTGFKEKHSGCGFVNAGVYLFRRSTLASFKARGPLSIEYDLFPQLIAKDVPIKVITATTTDFIDIGLPETYRAAEAFVANHSGKFAFPHSASPEWRRGGRPEA